MTDELRWRGKLISELTEDELRTAVTQLIQHIDFERAMHDRAMAAWKTCRDSRRTA